MERKGAEAQKKSFSKKKGTATWYAIFKGVFAIEGPKEMEVRGHKTTMGFKIIAIEKIIILHS